MTVLFGGIPCNKIRKGKNQMKKLLSLLLALALVMGCAASLAEETEAAPVITIADSTAENTLIVGSPDLNGDFIDGFGNSAYDNWVKTMLMEYCGTVEVARNGEIVENPMVAAGCDITTDDAGNKTYTWKIADDLKWSDGSQITATDYVASILWKASPSWLEAGASSSVGLGLLGSERRRHRRFPSSREARPRRWSR